MLAEKFWDCKINIFPEYYFFLHFWPIVRDNVNFCVGNL